MKEKLLLVTGFGVFPGAPENPTAWAMSQLEKSGWQPDGARLVVRTLPVTFDLWDAVMAPLLEELKPDGVVSFGLSAKATGVTLESTARNAVATDRPDFAGACAGSACVDEQGPQIHPTRLPLTDIVSALRRAGIPVARSDDAGDYLCNMLFYRLMAAGPAVSGFIHVPYLESQVARLKATGHAINAASTLTDEQMLRATTEVIQTCAQSLATTQTHGRISRQGA